jgi:FtsZ-interacting cell division protein ZipA
VNLTAVIAIAVVAVIAVGVWYVVHRVRRSQRFSDELRRSMLAKSQQTSGPPTRADESLADIIVRLEQHVTARQMAKASTAGTASDFSEQTWLRAVEQLRTVRDPPLHAEAWLDEVCRRIDEGQAPDAAARSIHPAWDAPRRGDGR